MLALNRSISKGICLNTGKWVCGSYVYHPKTNTHFIVTPNMEMRVVQPDSVCKFIGIYDQTSWESLDGYHKQYLKTVFSPSKWKGTPIFENDILEVHYCDSTSELAGQVIYSEETCSFVLAIGDDPNWIDSIDNNLMYVIAGNAFDNPILLKKMIESKR